MCVCVYHMYIYIYIISHFDDITSVFLSTSEYDHVLCRTSHSVTHYVTNTLFTLFLCPSSVVWLLWTDTGRGSQGTYTVYIVLMDIQAVYIVLNVAQLLHT